jgi:hypothetical protein
MAVNARVEYLLLKILPLSFSSLEKAEDNTGIAMGGKRECFIIPGKASLAI